MNLIFKEHFAKHITNCLILILPFVIFFWMLPFFSSLTFGNDYTAYPIQHQMELMFSLKMGSFPLFIPGFAGGQSSAALTLGQVFHPISHIASIFPGYWEGNALEWNSFFRLLFLGLAHLALFSFLRQLGFCTLLSLTLSLLSVYNLRMLDLFRYGASLESWTGFIFLCSSIGWYYLDPADNRRAVLIILSTYWLICSGHPQMMYYGLLGAGVFALAAPFYINEFLNNKQSAGLKQYIPILKVTVFIFAGIMLSAAYILPFYFEFITTNAGHVAQNFKWADTFGDSFIGTVKNFIYPLQSDVHGAYGGSSLILIPVLLPMLRLLKIRIPFVIWLLWGVFFLLFLLIQGARTPLFYLMWKYLPFASSIRIAGRLSFIIPMVLMLLLGWIMKAARTSNGLKVKNIQLSASSILSALSLLFIVTFLLLPSSALTQLSPYSATVIRNIPSWVEPAALVAGIACLAVIFFYGVSPNRSQMLLSALTVLTFVQITILLPHGTWVEVKKPTPSLARMLDEKQETLNYRPLPGTNLSTKAVLHHVRRTPMGPFLATIHKKFKSAESQEKAYRLMEEDRTPKLIIIESDSPLALGSEQPSASGIITDQVKLIYSSFNRIQLTAYASQAGFLKLSYPYSRAWSALVNHKSAPIYRANGVSLAIPIPEGQSKVELRYESLSAFWGMLISCSTFILACIFIGFRYLKKPNVVAFSLLSTMIGAGLFFIWYHSLHNGKNLGTRYTWKENLNETVNNIAYGKPTFTSPIMIRLGPKIGYIDPYFTYASSSRVVDGDRSAGSGLISDLRLYPFWYVDLLTSRQISSVAIFENRQNPAWNLRPLYVIWSNDRRKWQQVKVSLAQNFPARQNFEMPLTARYVGLMASGKCQLALDEVEIYLSDG